MTIRSILLFAPAESAQARLGAPAAAIALAKAQKAHLTIVCLALDVTGPGPAADSKVIAAGLARAAAEAGVAHDVVTEHSHLVSVHEVVVEHARHHDLSVVGTRNVGLLSERAVAEHLLFDSGRPVLLVPAASEGFDAAAPVAVAWDNGRAAARALGDAVKLFEPAQGVFLTINGEKSLSGDLEAGQIVEAAARRGLTARFADSALGSRSLGAALQEEASKAGAGLLVMGGFGHSRFRRFVLGSATGSLLEDHRMPVLLSN